MADDAHSTPMRAPHPNSPPINARQRRQVLEQALDRLLGAVDGILADLDALDGDADFEPDLGAPERHPGVYNLFDKRRSSQTLWAAGGDVDGREDVSEGEGDHDEREPEDYHMVPTYADDGANQLVIVTAFGGRTPISPSGVR